MGGKGGGDRFFKRRESPIELMFYFLYFLLPILWDNLACGIERSSMIIRPAIIYYSVHKESSDYQRLKESKAADLSKRIGGQHIKEGKGS